MSVVSSSARSSSAFCFFSLFLILFGVATATSCGSSASSSSTPKLSGNTAVTVILTSTANDQLSEFGLDIQTLSLTSQSGNVVNLVSSQLPAEFIHLNGEIEPLTSVTVPQDIYTSATATIGGASFTCVTILPAGSSSPGSLDTSTYAYGYTPNTNVTVNLPSPITVSGDSMGLLLDLMVSQSASFPSTCYSAGTAPFSITPTFNLTALGSSAQLTNVQNGKVTGLLGEITSIGTTDNSFTLKSTQGRVLSIKFDGNTIYQGIANVSALAVGSFMVMDGAIQPDGSLLASRIEVEDSSAVDVQSGPVLIIGQAQPTIQAPGAFIFNQLSQGPDPIPVNWAYDIHSSLFQVSGQLNNLQTLPFAPSFNLSNVVAGQNVYVSAHSFSTSGGVYTPAATITLMPQTINATVISSIPSGRFTDYTVELAPYDLFPTLAVQSGQTTLLTNPNQAEVYVDNSTQLLNTQALAGGGTYRFYGLVFNINGSLRMDCAQVNDGVAFTAPSNSNSQAVMPVGDVRTMRRQGAGGLQQTFTALMGSR